MSKSYLLGALHDGTIRRKTIRICQKEEEYIEFLRGMVLSLGQGAWTYREGRDRRLFVVEFSRTLLDGHRVLSKQDVIDYVRGYFDSEGGLPQSPREEPYIYFAQKDRADLQALQSMLVGMRIHCGKIHNPSKRADPDYWRFYVSRRSHRRFSSVIGSWHPRKSRMLDRLRTVRD